MTKLEFMEEGHTYWLDGVQIPSLSSILAPLDDFSAVPKDVLDRKAEHGTNIHETIRMYLDCNINMEKLECGNVIALRLFNKFRADNEELGEIVDYEKPIYHPKLRYGTTPDLVYLEAIVEIKTRPMKLYRDSVQLAGQAACFPEFPTKSKWVLFLDIKNNKYEFKRCEHRQAWSVFRKLLDRYKSEKEFSEFVEKWKGGCK